MNAPDDMNAADDMGAGNGSGADARLERRYRRLLAVYPARHRKVHGEEMLGVLLATSPGWQRRPLLADALNLIWGALRIRLRQRQGDPDSLAAGGWRDALAAFSIAAPLALTVMTGAGWLAAVLLFPWPAATFHGLAPYALELAIFGLGAALPFVVFRLRRIGALVCIAAAVLLTVMTVNDVYGGSAEGFLGGVILAFPFFSYSTEAAALLASPGPRRGLRILTGRSWSLILTAAAALGFLAAAVEAANATGRWPGTALLQVASHPAAVPVAVAVVAGVAATVAIVAAARSRLGRRILLVFALPMYPWLTGVFFPAAAAPVADAVTYLPPLVIAGLAVAAARRSRRAGPDGGQSARA